ncbi:invasion associated locus B family protein [Falsiroseomonas tokyonensis]|uniref:Invasion associated locus B family protein n=1 Tax=Falsiroseomonas tokyonensis TaxID=430521 RepID=A0ABV7BPP1_9PROT|nr:invasion associated locus B family protein [Falsiroseomonas tokyonensis]MBU8537002.1 invasion associated locus B family protein [Falsiroseomonas tokyonensis]
MVRIALPLIAALVLPFAAEAQRAQPQRLGAHNAWTAATHQENGQKVCYAFTRAQAEGAAAQSRQNVTLTVTHRPAGRDQVAVSLGAPLPRQAQVEMTVGSNEYQSYGTVQSSAFFQSSDGLINAFRAGREAVVRSPGAGRATVSDTFSLSGFTAAYEAISRECPAGRR